MIIRIEEDPELIAALKQINASLVCITGALFDIAANTKSEVIPSSIEIGVSTVAKNTVNWKFGGAAKGAKKTTTPIQLPSGPNAGIQIQTFDQNGSLMTLDPATVTTTLTVADPATATIAAGADSLHYTLTLPANATSPITLNGTETFTSGTPGPLSDSQVFLPPTPPVPVPTTIAITIA